MPITAGYLHRQAHERYTADDMAGIAVVGSVNMDLVIRTPHLPASGETVIGGGFITVPGGKGANQACAAARLGGTVRMLARVGADPFGEQLLANLIENDLITDDVRQVESAPTGVAVIVVHAGDNSIVIDPGANHRVTAEDVRAFSAHIQSADIVLVQLEVPLEVVDETVRVANETGTPVLLNPAPAARLSSATLSGVTYLTPNEGEAALLAGRAADESSELEAIVKDLRQLGVQTVCVTLGERGTAYTTADGSLERRAAHRVEAVDTTAAGDVFNGALAVALTEGRAFEEAVAFAQKAAAISVTRAGAGPSIPSRVEVDRFHSEPA